MNTGILVILVLLAIGGTLLLQQFMGGFLAFVPLMALGILAIFWGFRRSSA